MKKSILSLIAVISVACACNPEPIHPVNVVDPPEYIIAVEDSDYSPAINSIDEVKITGSGPFTAYYPASLGDNLSISTVQTAEELSSIKPAMIAESNNRILPFKSIFGTLAINISSPEELVFKSIVLTANQPLSGNFTMTSGKPQFEGAEGLTIDCGEGLTVGPEGRTIYLNLPDGVYDGFSFYSLDNLGRERIFDLGNRPFTIRRANVYNYDVSMGEFHQKRALMIPGPEFNLAVKALAANIAVDSTSYSDKKIKHLVFEVNSDVADGTPVQTLKSDYPIYINWYSPDAVLTVSTPASEIYMDSDMSSMFQDFSRLEDITGIAFLNTENVKDMSELFSQGNSTTVKVDELNLSTFNTSSVVSMDSMFFNMRLLTTLDLSSFDFDQCERMSHFLDQASKLTNLVLPAKMDLPKAEDLSYMFAGCKALVKLDISSIVAPNNRSIAKMFAEDIRLAEVNISGLNTEAVESMDSLFYNCRALTSIDLSHFNTAKTEYMNHMFYGCSGLKSLDLTSFSTSNVLSMKSMFNGCSALEELDISSFNVTVLNPNADYMFYQLKALKVLRLGGTFLINTNPSYFTAASDNAFSVRTGSVNGSITIYCNQSVADWISGTNFRWINSGYKSANAIPVTFIDYETGEKLQVIWANN